MHENVCEGFKFLLEKGIVKRMQDVPSGEWEYYLCGQCDIILILFCPHCGKTIKGIRWRKD